MVTKSSFVTSPISTTSNSPSSGCASGASFIPPPCQRPFATITSCIRPAALAAVERDRHLGVLPGRRTRGRARSRTSRGRRAPSTSSSPAGRPRRSSRPSRRSRRSGSPRRRRPGRRPGRGRRRAAVPSSATRDRVVELASGSRACARSPGPVPFGSTAISAPVPASAVDDLVQRPVAADDDDQLALAGRLARELGQVARAAPRGARRPRARARGRAARSFGQRFAGRAVRARRVDEEDTVSAQV